MTDQQTYSSNVGDPMLILRSGDLGNGIVLNQGYIELEIPDPVAEHGVRLALDTYKLLALIDAAAPDAMRGYLRETTEAVCTLGCAWCGDREVPQADSPEDVDEQPDPVDQLRESGRQLGEAWRAFTEGVRAGTFGTDR